MFAIVQAQPDVSPPHKEQDRRGSPRVHTVYFVVKVARHSDAGLFRVCNISDTGLMLASHVLFEPEEVVCVELTADLKVPGVIAWSEGFRCGVQFDVAIDSAAVLHARAEQKLDQRAGALRLPVSRLATCYTESGIRAVRITDVSRRGVGFLHDGSIQRDTVLKLVSESGTARSGVVCWSSDGRAGVRLDEPLSCEELESTRSM